MAWGILANAAVTASAAAAYALATRQAVRRQRMLRGRLGSASLLFAVISLFLAMASLRQVAAWLSTRDSAYVGVDRALFLVVVMPASLAIVPLVRLVAEARWATPGPPRAVAAAFLALVAVGIGFVWAGGVSGPVRSPYGSDWTINSAVSRVLIAAVILLPSLVASGLMVRAARRMAEPDRRRVRLIGGSCLLYFGLFTLDAYGLPGVALLAARAGTAVAGVIAWRAHLAPVRRLEPRDLLPR